MKPTQLHTAAFRVSGYKFIGEFGFSKSDESGIVISPPDAEQKVRAAWDAMDDGDISNAALDAVLAAGGEFVELI